MEEDEAKKNGKIIQGIQLPKSTFCLIRIAAILAICIMLAGDIESNPGPNTRKGTTAQEGEACNTLGAILEQINAMRKEINLDFANVNKRFEEINTRIDRMNYDLSSRIDEGIDGLSKNVTQIEEKIESVSESIENIADRVGNLEKENDELRKVNKHLMTKMDNIEGQNRRNNLIFYGFDETENESWIDCENKVKSHVKKMGIHEEPQIERAHRLKTRQKPRPIIVKFDGFKQKETILKKSREIKKERRKKEEVLPVVVNVTMYVTAENVNTICSNDPSLANCPDLITKFEEEFGPVYSDFDPDAYQGLNVTDISSWDDESLTVYTTEEERLIIDHFVEYKYTEFNQITEDEFINGVFGNNSRYGNFTYANSSVGIDTDFCNEEYYYPCESSFTFRCNDKNEPECASKCEDEFNWCNGGSCDAIGEISCDCSELENERAKYVGTQCTELECRTSGNMVYHGDTCELTSCENTDTKWYIGENCKFPVYKIWLIVGLSVGGAFFLFMITLLICLSCKLVGRKKVHDVGDSVDNSIISTYEEEDRYKLSSPALSGVKNPTYLHDEESGDSIHKDRPCSYFQPGA